MTTTDRPPTSCCRYSVDTGLGASVAPTLHLTRMTSYTFQMVGVNEAHPLVISTSETGPDARAPRGVVGTHPASAYGFFVFTPDGDTPSRLWYQSVTASGVGGSIVIEHSTKPEPR